MRTRKIILLGGGGHCRVLIGLLMAQGPKWKIEGILDPSLKPGSEIMGVRVLGNDSMLKSLKAKGISNACVAIGSVRDNSIRKAVHELAIDKGFTLPALVHPSAVVSPYADINSPGIQVMAGAVIQPSTIIGENSIINTGVIIDHDCKIGPHVHISPGAVLSGGVEVCEGAFIGAGAVLIQGVKVGIGAVVGAGAVVIKDVPANTVAKGVPAQ